jgi:hypothetical protein
MYVLVKTTTDASLVPAAYLPSQLWHPSWLNRGHDNALSGIHGLIYGAGWGRVSGPRPVQF